MGSKEKWQEIAEKKRSDLLNSIPSEWLIPKDKLPSEEQQNVSKFPVESGWFTDAELEITGASATELLERIRSRKWSSEQVTKAFCKRAAAAHQLTNCLTVCLFQEAISRSKELDKHLSDHGKPTGPLHGLPISLKDNFNIIGHDTTVGFVSWANDPAKYNSTMVEILQDAGAVLYCKTNVPTAMMIAETVNNVFGRTVNSRNRLLTSGGSSGGESALIAFGGSPLGVGTDIGGSLRIPAALTGIYTLRPSFGRFTTQGARSGLAGQEAVLSVNGPMSASFDSLSLFAKTVVDSQPWKRDPKCLPIPWRSIEKKEKLKLAVCWHDNVVRPTPPVARALKTTVERLKKAGHEIVEWDPKLHAQAASILSRFFVADGGKSVRQILDPVVEPFRPEMAAYAKAAELGVNEMWQLHLERNELCKAFLEQWQAVEGLDGLLLPVTPHAAVENGKFGRWVGYTGVFNIVDYSAVSFPTGVYVDKAVDQLGSDVHALSEIDKEIMESYNPDVIQGQPISLQLVAQRLEEEKVLAMTETVLKAL